MLEQLKRVGYFHIGVKMGTHCLTALMKIKEKSKVEFLKATSAMHQKQDLLNLSQTNNTY